MELLELRQGPQWIKFSKPGHGGMGGPVSHHVPGESELLPDYSWEERGQVLSIFRIHSQTEFSLTLLQWLQNRLRMAEARLLATLGFMAGIEVCGPLLGSQDLSGSNIGASKCLR